jgi:GNAT superfamily N-acetyltransferase
MTTTLRQLEEFALNALPSLQTLYYDGWVLRFAEGAGGYPRRANSIQMLYPSLLPLDEKIDFCESQYSGRGMKTVFKMTLAAPDGLDTLLKARGYELDCFTSVKTLDLAGYDPQPQANGLEVELSSTMTDAWADDNERLHAEDPKRSAVIRRVLHSLTVESAFVRLRREGETVALGRASLDRGWMGPYEIITNPRFRQQGYGRQLMLLLLRWAKERGAHHAYLQVVTENAPAQRLYRSLGFTDQYQYWYMQKWPPQ